MFERIVNTLDNIFWTYGIPVGDQWIPFIVICLLGTGLFLTLRLGFLQLRRLGHGFAVATGKYDDPDEPGDVSHFQALTTALSATVGIGNIAGVATAIHWGGPGALFWMWVTAFFGMALKYSEVTLAQHYREVEANTGDKLVGTVSGGPMYYIEKGLGPKWKPVAAFFAVALICTSFLTGNAVQANTISDTMLDEFGMAKWLTGLLTATVVALVILGGIKRIGRVTSILAPVMATIYVAGALTILLFNYDQVFPSFALVFREAFSPSAGIAGTGTGVFLLTLMWGVKRGLFSNEAGQGSAPIAHAAAQTDEPVSEGVVALLEPLIDTLIICTMTGLVILTTGVWSATVTTEITFDGDLTYVAADADGHDEVDPPAEIRIRNGSHDADVHLAWHEVRLERLYLDAELSQAFDGTIRPGDGEVIGSDGAEHASLFAPAVESGAPLTKLAFQRGLSPLGDWGGMIVIMSVLLFGISTAISWSYYGDRCANYLWGAGAILPYKIVFVGMHLVGALLTLATVWKLGDVALGMVTFPNLIAVIMLSGVVAKLTKSYFERKPWIENEAAHKKWVAEHKKR